MTNGGTARLSEGDSGLYDVFLVGTSAGGGGHVAINSGAQLAGSTTLLGGVAGSVGSATVASGTWRNSQSLFVGYLGDGSLFVNGGFVSASESTIGYNSGGTVAISSGTWVNSDFLAVGFSGAGGLHVNGGRVSVSGTLGTGLQSPGSGAVHLNGGTLSTKRLIEGDGSGTLTWDGGVLQALANEGDFLSGYEDGDVTLASGGAIFDSNGHSAGISTALSGLGGLTKIGEGTLTLSGSSRYGGGTTVSQGTLMVAHEHALGSGAVTVEGGVFHIGAGVVVSNDVVLAGGAFSRDVGGDLAGVVNATSELGGKNTTARILAGTSGVTTLVTSFSRDEDAFSDVYHLEGTGVAAFVLELSLASLESGLVLGWLDGDEWVNAVEGNTDNTATGGMLGFAGSFAEFQSLHGTNLAGYMGAYGSETLGGITSVWAVLNHNSAFAAIPEPSALLLLPAGILICLCRRRR